MKAFWSMAALNFFGYLILTVNFRAISHEQYVAAGLTAAVAAINGYVITKRIVADEHGWGLVGLVVGGSIADMVGIYLTRAWS